MSDITEDDEHLHGQVCVTCGALADWSVLPLFSTIVEYYCSAHGPRVVAADLNDLAAWSDSDDER